MKDRIWDMVYNIVIWIFAALMMIFFFIAALTAPIWMLIYKILEWVGKVHDEL